MQNLKRISVCGLLFILCLSACEKENDGSTPNITMPELQVIIPTSVTGLVIDENDQPITNAIVHLRSDSLEQSVYTDELGQFVFENFQNKGTSVFISVQADGKFEAFRRFGVFADRFNYTEIKMQNKNIVGVIDATSGGTLSNSKGAKIELPANAVITSSGTPYNGDLEVTMAWIDPSSKDLASNMIGDLGALDSEGKRRALATYGMLQVELLDGAGNKLNLAMGSSAKLQFPVPVSMQTDAPATIPLWSYDEKIGTWIEEGSANYQNGSYIGNVTHFSSWNIDKAFDPITVSGQVKLNIDSSSVNDEYLSIYVESDEIGRQGGWLCGDGSFRFINFPRGEAFNLFIYDICGNIVLNNEYGPFQDNVDLGILSANNTSTMIVVRGNVLSCDNEVITQGKISVIANERNQYFDIRSDGTFEFELNGCENRTAYITIVDLESYLQANLTVDNSQKEWIFNNTLLCEENPSFVSFGAYGNDPEILGPASYDVSTYNNFIAVINKSSWQGQIDSTNQKGTIHFQFSGLNRPVPFTIRMGGLRANLAGDDVDYFQNTNRPDLHITVTEFSNTPNGYIKGTYSGYVIDLDSDNHNDRIPVSGAFYALRSNWF